MDRHMEFTPEQLKYLQLLTRQFPTVEAASEEIINLRAILNLPKGTEHFLSDLHGEYESFLHILRNASGVIRRKIDDLFFNELTEEERDRLATLVYYPEEKLSLLHKSERMDTGWYRVTLSRLVDLCREMGSKYTRSKVRKALPQGFRYIIDELLNRQMDVEEKQAYNAAILDAILETDSGDAFLTALAQTIQRLAIDQLHIIGDVFDRGPGAHIIMDSLMEYHQVDIQWGNHDILWMGAAAGNPVCIFQVIVNCAKYDNLDTLEEGYGISLRQLATFANHTYGPNFTHFVPKMRTQAPTEAEVRYASRIHKAAVIILLKLEDALLGRNPEFKMEHRRLLRRLDLKSGTVEIEGKHYPLKDTKLPTMAPGAPWELTPEEQEVVDRLVHTFRHSEKLQRHVRFLYSNGSMYKRINGNLLYHGCIPMEESGQFTVVNLDGEELSGKAYIDRAERLARQGYFASPGTRAREFGLDYFWYLWCGEDSPLFGRKKMATFERYFLEDPALHREVKNSYYRQIAQGEAARRILREFQMNPETDHIINGHVPVAVKEGESPVKAGGKLFVIDGGLSRAYQQKTGIAGYTLIFDSRELQLVCHEPFTTAQEAIRRERDIHSTLAFREPCLRRLMVGDTDVGVRLMTEIRDLELLLQAYRQGLIS